MLPKKNRLLREEIKDILITGTRAHSPHLSFVFKKSPTQKNNQFAVVVSKKVSLLATERNKLKRRIRAILQKIEIKGGYARRGVFFTKPKSVKLTHSALKQELEELLKK